MVVTMSLMTIVLMIIAYNDNDGVSALAAPQSTYTIDTIIQIIFSVIIFVNGIIILYILNEEENERKCSLNNIMMITFD